MAEQGKGKLTEEQRLYSLLSFVQQRAIKQLSDYKPDPANYSSELGGIVAAALMQLRSYSGRQPGATVEQEGALEKALEAADQDIEKGIMETNTLSSPEERLARLGALRDEIKTRLEAIAIPKVAVNVVQELTWNDPAKAVRVVRIDNKLNDFIEDAGKGLWAAWQAAPDQDKANSVIVTQYLGKIFYIDSNNGSDKEQFLAGIEDQKKSFFATLKMALGLSALEPQDGQSEEQYRQELARLSSSGATLGAYDGKLIVYQNGQSLTDAAMNGFDAAAKPEDSLKGGIDFAQSNLDMQIKRDGNGVPLPVSQQNLDNIRIDGLEPHILKIRPAAEIPGLWQ